MDKRSPTQNPESPGGGQGQSMTRRGFFERVAILLAGVGSALLAFPMVGFILAPVLRREPSAWRYVGDVDSFQVGKTVAVQFQDPSPLPWAGVTANNAAWLRRESETVFTAFAINCTHLGCPVRWLPQANLFMCPCHGGVYYPDGRVAAGPPPKPLPRYATRVVNGRVLIQTQPITIT